MNTSHSTRAKSLALLLLGISCGIPLAPKASAQVPWKQPVQVTADKGKAESFLYVVYGDVKIAGAPIVSGAKKDTIEVRSYTLDKPTVTNGIQSTKPLVPGPTYVVQPGDLLRVKFQNYLNRSTNPSLNAADASPQTSGPGSADQTSSHVSHEISIPNDVDITNLHVHGLHVDPKQDNVTLLVLPQDNDPSMLIPELQRFVPTINRWWTRTYQYKLPADHLPGTFWYHAHKHGSTSAQVENGMAGNIIIRPRDDSGTLVPGLWEAGHDRIMMLQEIANFEISQSGGDGKTSLRGVKHLASKAPANVTGGVKLKSNGGSAPPPNNLNAPVTTINGEYQPTLTLPATQVERWRFVIAGGNHTTSAYLWVGSITPVLSAQTQAALQAITTPAAAVPYVNGTTPFPDQTPLVAQALPGTVKVISADGIDLWQPRDITPSSPGMGSAGNRLDFLVQAATGAVNGTPYYVCQNYPVPSPSDQTAALVAAYPTLFGSTVDPALAQARLSAITSAKATSPAIGSTPPPSAIATSVTDAKGIALSSATFVTDPFQLSANPAGFPIQWTCVDASGKHLKAGENTGGPLNAQQQLPIGPLLRGTSDGQGVSYSKKPLSEIGWQPMPDWGPNNNPPPTNAILVKLNITNDKPSGPTTIPTDLDTRASSLSPAGSGQALEKVDPITRKLVPGIPSYVSPIKDSDIAGRQVVVFDRGQFTFKYVDKSTQKPQQFRQFWITGRQFSVDDWVGNPATESLMNTPLVNSEPALGSYTPNAAAQAWTHQKSTPAGASIIIANPGYTAPLKLYKIPASKDGTIPASTAYNYDLDAEKPLTYERMTGLKESPHTPVSTTAEEWLLINNSDLFHPFHIHISPFFVTEIGELDCSPGSDPNSPNLSIKKVTLKDASNTNVPFSWVVGNWWDVITLPPHGYVRMRTWINVPSQMPIDEGDPNSDLVVYDNANVYGSWVMHCHILRHEDRGMMSMVNSQPKGTNLSGTWTQDDGDTNTVVDEFGGLTITHPTKPKTTPSKVDIYPGTFNRGMGNPLFAQPWLGSMSPSATVNLSFCATSDGSKLLRSNGRIWAKGTTAPPAIRFVPIAKVDPKNFPKNVEHLNLSGTWTDDNNNQATITQSAARVVPGSNSNALIAQLTFTPLNQVWWKSGTGYWAPPPQPPPPPPQPQVLPLPVYAGSQTVVNNAGQNQTLTFCVSGDLKTIIFGNGVKWTKN